jgi:Bacterial protein of unknown function (DUF899)
VTNTTDTQSGPNEAVPAVVAREAFEAELAALRTREKAHTNEGDAIRRRLSRVEVDAATPRIGENGPVTLLNTFEGRPLLISYYDMRFAGEPASEQCEGCTLYNGEVRKLRYLHERNITYASFYQSYHESVRYRDFTGWDDYSDGLIDLTVYRRREDWEDSPAGWPKGDAWNYRSNGRPIARWCRIEAGRSDGLTGSEGR